MKESVFYKQMDINWWGVEMETAMVRLGRLWSSGKMVKDISRTNIQAVYTVEVCKGLVMNSVGERLWFTATEPFEAVKVIMVAINVEFLDYYLCQEPYEAKDVVNEAMEFIEDYLL